MNCCHFLSSVSPAIWNTKVSEHFSPRLLHLLHLTYSSTYITADQFAKSLQRAADLRSALVKIHQDNLSFPVHDSLYSQWKHSHPTLIQRIDALGKLE